MGTTHTHDVPAAGTTAPTVSLDIQAGGHGAVRMGSLSYVGGSPTETYLGHNVYDSSKNGSAIWSDTNTSNPSSLLYQWSGGLILYTRTAGAAEGIGSGKMSVNIAGAVNIDGLTASQYVKTDGSKNLVSSASFTAAHQYAIQEGADFSVGDAACLKDRKVSKCSSPYAINAVGIYMREHYDFDSVTNTRQKVGYVISIGDLVEWENTIAGEGNYTSRQTGFGLKVTNENGDIKTGDLLVTSSTHGYLMKQSDNVIRSYTVAKAMQDVEFDEEGRAQGIYGFIYGG